MWNCKSIHLAPSLQRRINSFIEDFVCFTKTDDCITPRNHIYHLGASAGRKNSSSREDERNTEERPRGGEELQRGTWEVGGVAGFWVWSTEGRIYSALH